MTEPNLYIVRSLSSGFLDFLSSPYPYPDLRLPHLYVPEQFVVGPILEQFVVGPILGLDDRLSAYHNEIMLGRREQMPRRDFYLADDHETLEQYKHGLEIGKLEVLMLGQVPIEDLKNLAEKLRTLHINLESHDVGIKKSTREEANEAIRYIIQTHFRIDSGEQK